MKAESKLGAAPASRWGVRIWAGMLAGLVLCWVCWGAIAFVKMRSGPRVVLKKTASGAIKRLVWKRPNYRKFKTLSQAIKEAQRLRKPIFLDLYADWCVPCKKLEKETFSHPYVHPVMSQYVVVKFNVDYAVGKRLSRRFRVRYYPTTLMLNSNGKEVERVIGFYPPRYYRPALVSVLKGEGHYHNLIRRNRQNPKDLEVMLQLASRSILRRNVGQARRLFSRVWEQDKDGAKGFGPRALFGLARSHSRVGKYRKALPYLATFMKRFPDVGRVHREALRLQMFSYGRLRRYAHRKRTMAIFRRLYPDDDPKYK